MGYYDFYNRKTIREWFNEKNRPKGMNKASAEYYRGIKQVERELGRNNIILYFLLVDMGMSEVRQMLISGIKQRNLCKKAKVELLQYAVTKEWQKIFVLDIRRIHDRAEYVQKIIKENIKLTELYPYFETIGFERLMDFSRNYASGNEEAKNQLKKEIEEWNAEHPEEIATYMKSIAKEKAIHDAYIEKIKADKTAEKERRKLAKKAEREEIREIKKNNEKYQKEKRRIDKSFEYLFK